MIQPVKQREHNRCTLYYTAIGKYAIGMRWARSRGFFYELHAKQIITSPLQTPQLMLPQRTSPDCRIGLVEASVSALLELNHKI